MLNPPTIEIQCTVPDEFSPKKNDFMRWMSIVAEITNLQFKILIRLVDEDEIRTLNIHHRSKSNPTNILSFSDDATLVSCVCGTLVMCNSVINQQAHDTHKKRCDHWAHLTIHGLLHLSGMDHVNPLDRQQMEAMEISILNQLHIENPYNL